MGGNPNLFFAFGNLCFGHPHLGQRKGDSDKKKKNKK
jgi:hypothetical protein